MKLLPAILSSVFLTFSACQTDKKQEETVQNDIVFKDNLGHSLSKSDIANTTGKINYEIMENQNIDPKAQELHQEARQLGQSGQYDQAIAKLDEATKIQPNWAYPFYDLAFTYLLKGDFDNALKFYKRTDELEPKGFFTAKTALYSLEGEKEGKFPKGLYTAYMQIEWTADKNKKLEIAQMITQKVPEFAPGWKELSSLLDDKSARLDAIEKGLSKNPDAETKGILLINKALVLNDEGKKEEAKQLLGNLIFSSDVTRSNEELAKFTLKTLTGE